MSDLARFEIFATSVQVVILIVVIAKTNKLMINQAMVLLPFFFVLAMLSYLFSDVYWIVYDFLKPDTRMPIAANEFGECALILLLSAGLETILTDKKKLVGEVAFACLFISANIALWIVWSGEWLQDILFGAPYIYFLWLLIRGVRTRGLMKRNESFAVLVMSVSVLVMLTVLLFVDGVGHAVLKASVLVTMFAMMLWLAIKSFRRKDFFVATTFFLCTSLAMFATPDPYYNVPFLANTAALPLMFMAMKKELASNALR